MRHFLRDTHKFFLTMLPIITVIGLVNRDIKPLDALIILAIGVVVGLLYPLWNRVNMNPTGTPEQSSE